jgi:excisionase family DNA binding protein
VSKWVSQGRLTSVGYYAKRNLLRSDVERLSAARRRPGDRSWLTTRQAAEVMGVTNIRVNQLARAGRLPHELSRDGWRLFRPEQVAVIGNARRVRFHTHQAKGGLSLRQGSRDAHRPPSPAGPAVIATLSSSGRARSRSTTTAPGTAGT